MSSTNVDNVQMGSVINTVFWRVKTEPEEREKKKKKKKKSQLGNNEHTATHC